MTDYLITFLAGFITFPIFIYIGIPLLKKWLMKKWKLEPKKDVKRKRKEKD